VKTKYIAEIGNNHNGDINLAKKMINAAIASDAELIPELYLGKMTVSGNKSYDAYRVSDEVVF
jgi:sialic acid synthase SpsE|tara:strand:+ start:140 stop:328 length:189 start_codon:yes stop_codon:yes gene_type:complete